MAEPKPTPAEVFYYNLEDVLKNLDILHGEEVTNIYIALNIMEKTFKELVDYHISTVKNLNRIHAEMHNAHTRKNELLDTMIEDLKLECVRALYSKRD